MALCLVAAPSALATSGPDLKTTVSATPNPVAAGQYTSLNIGVSNVGDQTAHNVVVKSFMPSGTMYIPSDSRCSLVGSTVECPIGDLVAGGNENVEVILRLINFSFHGTIQNFVTAHTSDTDVDHGNDGSDVVINVFNNSHDHHLTIEKTEMAFSLPAGSGIKTFKLECPKGDEIMTDGAVRVDNVDQDTGTLRSVSVLASFPEGNGYRFTLVNYASGQAQGHLFGTCIPGKTEGANADSNGNWHQHDLIVSGPKSVTETFTAGQYKKVKVSCDAGPGDFVAVVAPGYGVNGAEGALRSSMPAFDANGRPAWEFGFAATQGGSVTFYIRCLNRYVGTTLNHTHELWLSHPDKWFTIPDNAPAGGTYDIDCSDEAKGIVAGWDFDDGLWMIGNDPQPKRRSFKILNDSGSDKSAHIVLLCIGDRTGTDPPPPVAPSAIAPTATVASSGASIPVKVSCPASGCGGVVELLASGSGTRAVASAAKVIGRGNFKTTGRGVVIARVKVLKKYRSAVASGRISRVTAVVRKGNGKVAKRVSIRLKR